MTESQLDFLQARPNLANKYSIIPSFLCLGKF